MRWVWELQKETVESSCREPLVIKDIPVRGLFVAARIMAETWKGYISEKGAVDFLQRLLPVGEVYPFVAYREGQAIGSAVAVKMGHVAEIHGGVHVLPEWRRRHVGTAILVAVLKALRGRGIRLVFVVREVKEPLTEDDRAAIRLYDGAGGERRAALVEMLYTPQCPFNAYWLEQVRCWLEGYDVTLEEVDIWRRADRAAALLADSPLAGRTPGGLILYKNVFFRVFVEGILVGDIPPRRDDIMAGVERLGGRRAARATGPVPETGVPERQSGPVWRATGWVWRGEDAESLPDAAPSYPSLELLRERTAGDGTPAGTVSVRPLGPDSLGRAMSICLSCHPSGIMVEGASAERGMATKTAWYREASTGPASNGVLVLRGDRPVGLLEFYPRGVARRAGYMTGSWGSDEEVLTVTCVEVAAGEERQQVMEQLLAGCLLALKEAPGQYRYLEAAGVYGRPLGFNPFWLYDKYGFRREEERVPGRSAILSYPIRT